MFLCGQLAQSVEQRTENPRVRGSNPRLPTTILSFPLPLVNLTGCIQAVRKPGSHLHSSMYLKQDLDYKKNKKRMLTYV